MTKHELLSIMRDGTELSATTLSKISGRTISTSHDMITDCRRRQFIKFSHKRGKEKVYIIGEAGINRLEWYDEHGCSVNICSCHDNTE